MNNLTEFPFNLGVKKLDLSANYFTTLSFTAENLTFLDVSQNDLKEFPTIKCSNLRTINAAYNSIETLPETMTVLGNLRNLNLSNNYITNLPKSFCMLTKITALNLKNNPISDVPPYFTTLKIKKLNVSKTKNFLFQPLPSLQELIYDNVGADVLFDDFSSLTEMENMILSHNKFKSINGIPKNLVTLDIAHNELTTLVLNNDCKVQKMFLRYNNLSSLDPSVISSQKLMTLDVSNNNLSSLPDNMNMAKLKYLSASFNHLSNIDVKHLAYFLIVCIFRELEFLN